MRLKMGGNGKSAADATRRDLSASENPWNGMRERFGSTSGLMLGITNSKCTTREKVGIQPPSSASSATTTGAYPMNRDLAQQAGEVEGSGNALLHDRKLAGLGNATRAKRCLRERGIHDLAIRQQFLSASLVSCSRSTT